MTSRDTARAVPSSDGHARGLESIVVGWLFYRNSANGASPMDLNSADYHREWAWNGGFVIGNLVGGGGLAGQIIDDAKAGRIGLLRQAG